MTQTAARTGLQLRSLIRASGQLELSLVDEPTPSPASDEVVIRVEPGAAAPAPSAVGAPGASGSPLFNPAAPAEAR